MIQVTQNGIELLAHFLPKLKTQWNDVDITISPQGLTLCSRSIGDSTSLLCKIHSNNFENLPDEIIKTRIDTKYLASVFAKAKQFDTISIDVPDNNILINLINDKLKVSTSLPLIMIDNPHGELNTNKMYKEDHFELQINLKDLKDILSMLDGYIGGDECFDIEKISDQAIMSSTIDRTSNKIEIPTLFLQGFKFIDKKVQPAELDGCLHFGHKTFKQSINLIKSDDDVTFMIIPDALMLIHQVSDDYELILGIGGSARPYQPINDLDMSDWDDGEV